MALYLVGIGLSDEKDVSVRGLEVIRGCSEVYLEGYTSLMSCSVSDLEGFYGKKIAVVGRSFVEQSDVLVSSAAGKDVALLVIGDPWGATTHIDIMMRCRKAGVDFRVINNGSIITAVGITGLQIYKFGKTTSVPFPEANFRPETSYEVIRQNRILGLHTLLLFDIRQEERRFMTVSEAIGILLGIESRKNQGVFTPETFCVGCARIGSDDFVIRAAPAKDLKMVDFGVQPHCLIVPGELHFVEEEALEIWKK